MAHMTKETILARDAELTRFKHYALDNPNEWMNTIIDNFPFQLIDATRFRANLITIGYDARRHPHRVPPK